jgi:hypothetical protein
MTDGQKIDSIVKTKFRWKSETKNLFFSILGVAMHFNVTSSLFFLSSIKAKAKAKATAFFVSFFQYRIE